MFRIICLSFCLLALAPTNAQKSISILKALYNKNHNHWYHNLTFVQTTEQYRNDSLFRKATWYETLKLPYDLRIDLDTPSKGNFVLYKKDSVYRFQKGQLRNVAADTNPFIFFIGGMYFQPFDSVVRYLEQKGYDLNKGYETTWKGNPTYVTGRANEQDSSNAIWIDLKNMWIARLAEKSHGQLLDAQMNGHKKLAKGITETQVDIYLNGKLVQVEKYDQIKEDVLLDDDLFDPAKAARARHWKE